MFRKASQRDSDTLDKFIYYRELGYSAEASEFLSRVTYGDENLARHARQLGMENGLAGLIAWVKEREENPPADDSAAYYELYKLAPGGNSRKSLASTLRCSYSPFEELSGEVDCMLIEPPTSGGGRMAYAEAYEQKVMLCRKLPETDSYESIEEKDAKNILTAPTSTFRMTTSNASLGIVLNQLRNGRSVDMSQVRIEELLNAFDYDAGYPTKEKFRISTERMAKDDGSKEILYINVQSAKEEKEHQNIILLLDVSGSMSSNDEVTQAAAATIFSKLKAGDTVSLVTYSDTDRTVLDGYTIRDEQDKEKLMAALMGIEIGGCTYGSAGIMTAYELGRRHYREGWSNQVILITDGDLNFGITEKHGLQDLIEEKKKTGLFLSVVGTGLYNYKDDKLETLSKHGNGTYCVVNSLPDVDEFINKRYISLTNIIAKDVKAQVEFNPKFVKSYRLLGYENRELNHEDFRNDAVISEPYGSGGHGIALYEIERSDGALDSDLKYVRHELVESPELGTVRINYKDPLGEKSHEIGAPIFANETAAGFFGYETGAASNVKLAYLIYCAAEMLRKSDKMDDDDKVYLWSMTKDSTFKNIAGTPDNEEKLACLLKRPSLRARSTAIR